MTTTLFDPQPPPVDVHDWCSLCNADTRIELIALNLLCIGRGRPAHPLEHALERARQLVGPGRRSRRGPAELFTSEALKTTERRLHELAGGTWQDPPDVGLNVVRNGVV